MNTNLLSNTITAQVSSTDGPRPPPRVDVDEPPRKKAMALYKIPAPGTQFWHGIYSTENNEHWSFHSFDGSHKFEILRKLEEDLWF